MYKSHRIPAYLLSLLMSSQMFSLVLMANETSESEPKSSLKSDSSLDKNDPNRSDQDLENEESSNQEQENTDPDSQDGTQETPDNEEGSDNPAENPEKQPGINSPGSVYTENEDGTSYTVHCYTEQGVHSQSLITRTTGRVISVEIDLQSISQDTSLKNPLMIDLGINPVLSQPITLSGSETEADQAVPITFKISETMQNPAVSIPLASSSAAPGTVAVNTQTGSVLTRSIAEENALKLFVSDDLTVKILNRAQTFADMNGSLPNYWKEAASFLSSRGLMTGIHDGIDFDPQGTVTRGQLAAILYRYEGSPETEGPLPEGVSKDDFFANASKWAVHQGLMGVGSLFNGGKLLTREELTTILYRFARIPDPVNLNVLNHFPDRIAVSSWAIDGMAWAIENHIIGLGVSELDPKSDGKRIDLAVMVERFISNMAL